MFHHNLVRLGVAAVGASRATSEGAGCAARAAPAGGRVRSGTGQVAWADPLGGRRCPPADGTAQAAPQATLGDCNVAARNGAVRCRWQDSGAAVRGHRHPRCAMPPQTTDPGAGPPDAPGQGWIALACRPPTRFSTLSGARQHRSR